MHIFHSLEVIRCQTTEKAYVFPLFKTHMLRFCLLYLHLVFDAINVACIQ